MGKKEKPLKNSHNHRLNGTPHRGFPTARRPSSFYSVNPTKEPILILAEIGAEYSWGVRVFLLNQNLEVKDLALLDVAVEPDTEFRDGPESAIPFTHVVEDNGRYRFTFTKDVIYDPGGLNDKKVHKEDISYYYDGDALKLIMSSD